MFQSVFTNRYGSSNWTDITFYFIDMITLLYVSNSFTNTSSKDLTTFFLAASPLSFTLFLQYLIVFFKSSNSNDKNIAKSFCSILTFRTLTLLVGDLFNTSLGRLVAFLGIIISWILPSFTGKYTKKHPIIFSHLLGYAIFLSNPYLFGIVSCSAVIGVFNAGMKVRLLYQN
ncbi:low temperature requirement protein A [Lactobacillus taiwanensis]|uniref:low temperature requirement protein A n=1 Tax=Lactobacillus taiwanensis TaxID=508451 RepID=UPI0020A69E96|nr:low temperature requirement protein A [Lactobacillus taiwanensis]